MGLHWMELDLGKETDCMSIGYPLGPRLRNPLISINIPHGFDKGG